MRRKGSSSAKRCSVALAKMPAAATGSTFGECDADGGAVQPRNVTHLSFDSCQPQNDVQLWAPELDRNPAVCVAYGADPGQEVVIDVGTGAPFEAEQSGSQSTEDGPRQKHQGEIRLAGWDPQMRQTGQREIGQIFSRGVDPGSIFDKFGVVGWRL